MGHGSFAIVVKSLSDIAKKGAPADSGLPGRFVYRELLEVLHIDYDDTILAATDRFRLVVSFCAIM
jgi:hypothetical protein